MLLLDPYARAITGGVDYSGPIHDHTAESHYLPDPVDSSAAVPWSVVVADTPPPRPIARRRPLDECVIYETHVKGYTRLHPLVPEHLRGRYGGLAYPAVIDHLLETGINAIQLLPATAAGPDRSASAPAGRRQRWPTGGFLSASARASGDRPGD